MYLDEALAVCLYLQGDLRSEWNREVFTKAWKTICEYADKAMKYENKIPDHAEKHILSDFIRYRPGERSKLVPNRTLPSIAEFYCPACGDHNPMPMQAVPEHGIPGKCTNCDLHWCTMGNSLWLWKNA